MALDVGDQPQEDLLATFAAEPPDAVEALAGDHQRADGGHQGAPVGR